MKPTILLLCAFATSAAAMAQPGDPASQRVTAIREAALEIWRVQRTEGNGKAMALVNQCHRDVRRTKQEYDDEVETCLVRDYYVTTSSAAFFSRMSAEWRQANKIDVARMEREMIERAEATHRHFGISSEEGIQVDRLLRENVMQAVLIEMQRK